MEIKEYRSNISKSVLSVRKKYGLRYCDVKIDKKYSIISVLDYFFTQGGDCDEILKEVEMLSSVTELSERTCLLYILDTSGVFN